MQGKGKLGPVLRYYTQEWGISGEAFSSTPVAACVLVCKHRKAEASLLQASCLAADTSLPWNCTLEILVRKTEAKLSFTKEQTSFGLSIFLSTQKTGISCSSIWLQGHGFKTVYCYNLVWSSVTVSESSWQHWHEHSKHNIIRPCGKNGLFSPRTDNQQKSE